MCNMCNISHLEEVCLCLYLLLESNIHNTRSNNCMLYNRHMHLNWCNCQSKRVAVLLIQPYYCRSIVLI